MPLRGHTSTRAGKSVQRDLLAPSTIRHSRQEEHARLILTHSGRSFSWPPTSQTVKMTFLYCTFSTLKPARGKQSTNSSIVWGKAILLCYTGKEHARKQHAAAASSTIPLRCLMLYGGVRVPFAGRRSLGGIEAPLNSPPLLSLRLTLCP